MTVTKPFSSSLVCTQTANLALGLLKLHVICAGQIGAWNRVHTIVNSRLPLETLALTYELVLSTFFTLIGNINYKMNFILNQTQPLERQYCIYLQSKSNGKHTCKHIHSKYTDKHRENSFTSSKGSTTGKGQAALWMSNNGEGILWKQREAQGWHKGRWELKARK